MKNFLSIDDYSREALEDMLKLAKHYSKMNEDGFVVKAGNGKTLVNLFFENSTRTCTSFDIAAAKLGMKVVNLGISTSSIQKGESLTDTILAISAMNPTALVIRCGSSDLLNIIKSKINCCIINAGDGINEHPTQALQDLYTVQEKIGKITKLNVAICGDFFHSRVAHSNSLIFRKFDCKISVISSPAITNTSYSEWLRKKFGIEVFHDFHSGARGYDVIIALRIQRERMQGCYLPSEVEYFNKYGISSDKLYLAPKAIILHPGPVNRNVDMSSFLTDNKSKSIILNQISNGIHVRQSVISYSMGLNISS